MARPARLEAFEVIEGGAAAGPSEDWREGHAAGMAEALAASRFDQAALSEALVQRLADMSFGYHEARGHLIASLAPLFTQLIEAFVPRLGRAMLVPFLAESLAEAAGAALDGPITLRVSEAEHDAIAAALAGAAQLPFALRADPALTPGQALLDSGAGESALDIDALIGEAQGILASLLDVSQQRSNHG